MGRPRPKRGERRIDAAIDHLAQYGFDKPRIRKVLNDLVQVYGREGWPLLEQGSYRAVLDVLEEQAQQDQKQEVVAAEEASPPQNGMEASQVHSEAPNESRSAPTKGPPCAKPPCYGWISEESETESEVEDGEMLSDVIGPVIFTEKDIPNPMETLPSKRK